MSLPHKLSFWTPASVCLQGSEHSRMTCTDPRGSRKGCMHPGSVFDRSQTDHTFCSFDRTNPWPARASKADSRLQVCTILFGFLGSGSLSRVILPVLVFRTQVAASDEQTKRFFLTADNAWSGTKSAVNSTVPRWPSQTSNWRFKSCEVDS